MTLMQLIPSGYTRSYTQQISYQTKTGIPFMQFLYCYDDVIVFKYSIIPKTQNVIQISI